MRIADIFRQNTVEPRRAGETDQAARRQEAETKTVGQQGEDTVTISRISRRLNQIAEIIVEDEQQSSQKVEELKAQVEAGTYQVSSEDVANSLISFAQDAEG